MRNSEYGIFLEDSSWGLAMGRAENGTVTGGEW